MRQNFPLEKGWVRSIEWLSFLVVLFLSLFLSSLFGISTILPLGGALVALLVLLFFRKPLLFLCVLIPIRMMLDFSGEFFFVSISDTLTLSLSQVIGVFVFGIGVLFFLTYSREAWRSVKILFTFWLFLIWGVISLSYSIAPGDTLRDTLRMFDILALSSLAFVFVRTRKDMKQLVVSMLVSAFVPILFGLWQFVSGAGYSEEFTDIQRIYGTFGHPNVFGMYLFMILVLDFFFWRFFVERKSEKIFSISVGVLAFFLIFLTLSRVSWAILLFFFFVVGVMKSRKIILPTVFVVVAALLFVPSIQDRVMEIFDFSADSSVLWRINIWSDAIRRVTLEERGWFGFGLDAFPTVISDMHTSSFGSNNAHNDFVKFFVEGGIIGLVLYIFWFGHFALTIFQKRIDVHLSQKDRELATLLFLLLVSLGLASLSDAVFKSTPLQWLLWIFLGAFLGLTETEKNVSLEGHRNSND